MIQLTDTLYWDESLLFNEQSNEVKNYVSNLIENTNRVVESEDIPRSNHKRKTKCEYICQSGAIIAEIFKYKNKSVDSGWLEIKTHTIECYG